MQGFVVKQQAVAAFPVFSKRLTMVGDNRNQALIVESPGPQRRQELAKGGVHIGNFTVVRRSRVSLVERWRWIIRIMRVVKMQPKKERIPGMLVEPCQGAV